MPVFKRVKSPSTSSSASGSSGQVAAAAAAGESSQEQTDSPLLSKPGRFRTGSKKEAAAAATPSPPPPERAAEKEIDNFFDFNPEDVDVWDEPNLVHNLRKSAKKRMSVKLQPDREARPLNVSEGDVETIGSSFVGDEEGTSMPPTAESASHGRIQSVRSPPTLPTLPTFTIKTSSERGRADTMPISPSQEAGALDQVAALEREIERLKVIRWQSPTIPDTINRLLLGQSCSLDWYKSLAEMRALLDAAIATNDGNCVMAILLHIRRSIEHTLMMGILVKRPAAMRQYCCFLRQLEAWKELTSVYRVLGDYVSLGYLKLVQCESEESVQTRIDLVRSCHIMFKNNFDLQENAYFVEEYGKLLEKQMRIEEADGRGRAVMRQTDSVLFHSLTTTLLYCCRKHWNEPENRTCSPEGLKKLFQISDKQYFQMSLLALAINRKWSEIEALLTTKSVLRKKKKSPIGFERVVKTLAKRAPDDILAQYLNEVEDLESRLQLATEIHLFDVGLDTLKLLKDRDRLSAYINNIPPKMHYKYRPVIEAILRNTQIKWK